MSTRAPQATPEGKRLFVLMAIISTDRNIFEALEDKKNIVNNTIVKDKEKAVNAAIAAIAADGYMFGDGFFNDVYPFGAGYMRLSYVYDGLNKTKPLGMLDIATGAYSGDPDHEENVKSILNSI